MEDKLCTIEELLNLGVKEKLDFLRKYDKNYCLFGSGKHKYQLNEPLSEEQIHFFEEKYGIKLPEEYRNFVKNIGDGGAGPGYGLFPLFENEKSSQHLFLKESFLLKEDFDLDEYEEHVTCNCLDCKVCEKKDTCLTYEIGEDCLRYQTGTLAICFEGCTYYSRLIVNGERYGEIWAESEGDGIKRANDNFSKWYNGWLDMSIRMIYPFVNAVLNNMPFEKIMEIKGGHLLHFDYRKAVFVAGMTGIDIALKANSGKAREEYKEKVKKAYESLHRKSK